MGLDLNNKNTYFFVDKYNLILRQNYNWEIPKNFGKQDCIGRTLMGYIAYEYDGFVSGVKLCFKLVNPKTIVGYRHPDFLSNEYNDMSRDHILNALILMKISGNERFLRLLSDKLKWKISDRFNFTIPLWLWMKGIAGNKLMMFLYYLIEIPLMFFTILWNKTLWKIGGFKPEPKQEYYVKVQNKDISKWKKFIRKKMFPYFTLLQYGFLLYASPNSIGNKILRKICLWGTPRHNYLMKMLFGGNVTKEEVWSYKSMMGDRWSTVLNEISDRDLQIITKPEYLEANVLDVDIVRNLYEKIYEKPA